MIKHIILVSVGIFQEYILTNIEQLVKLGFKIHVITDKVFYYLGFEPEGTFLKTLKVF